MTEAVKPNEKLADVIDATKRSWRRDNNNLAASGQIQMQFSSIMRTFVDSPEKMMEVATAQSKVQADDRSQPVERDDFRSRVREQRRASGREVDGNDRPAETRPERAKQAEKPKAPSGDTANDQPKAEAAAAPKSEAPVEKTETKVGKSFQDEILDAQQTIIQAAPQQQPTEVATDPVVQVLHQQATAELEHGAQTAMAGALTDKNFSRVGQDMHDAANAIVSGTKAPQTAGPTAANSLRDEQESDLANRLSGMGQFQIQVDNANGAAKTNSNPFHGLNANVNFGKFDGLDTEGQSPSGDLFKGDTTGSEQKAPSTHANIPVDTRNAAPSPQDLANVLGQAARAQAAMAGQQPGAMAGIDAKSMAPSDAIQAVGAAAPAGPSQLSQTAKANPTTAAHQPEKPQQTAAEQIAVKIRQAVGEGADKINIKLNPHELGRVEVRLELSKDGGVTATVLAERQETLDILQKDVRGLERALNDAGLKTDAASLNFGLRGEGQKQADVGRDRRNGSNNRNDERAAAGRIEFGDKAGLAKSAAYQRTLGANSGVDIRV
jgi:flagellar hook-length control protein FliK